MRQPPDGPPSDAMRGIDPLDAEVLAALRKAMHLNRQYMGRMAGGQGTHPGQAGCLRTLATHGGISQRDLADMLHLSRPTVTTMLQKLESEGLIERWTDEQDQRLTRLRLSRAGHDRAGQLHGAFKDYVANTIGRMSVEERRDLARLLTALADHTERALCDLGETPSADTGPPGAGHARGGTHDARHDEHSESERGARR